VLLTTERAKEPPHFWLASPAQGDVQAVDVLMEVSVVEASVLPHQHSLPYSVPERG